jgi:hypothetical protein
MATTNLGIPLFAQSDSADVATKLNAISNSVDTLLKASLTNPVIGSGGVLAGAYNAAKQTKVCIIHGTATSTSSALISVDISSLGATALLSAIPSLILGGTGSTDCRLVLRTDTGTGLTALSIQTRNVTAATALASAQVEFMVEVLYQ